MDLKVYKARTDLKATRVHKVVMVLKVYKAR
jgi:hypothetical protein